jgi:hypothetical protein
MTISSYSYHVFIFAIMLSSDYQIWSSCAMDVSQTYHVTFTSKRDSSALTNSTTKIVPRKEHLKDD